MSAPVKPFSSALLYALKEERHFALIGGVAFPTVGSLVIVFQVRNSGRVGPGNFTPSLSRNRIRMTCPLRFTGIALFHRYYGAVRPCGRLGTFGLAGLPLVPFPLSSPARFSSSVQKPGVGSRHLYTGHRMVSKQVASMLLPDQSDALVSMSSLHFR